MLSDEKQVRIKLSKAAEIFSLREYDGERLMSSKIIVESERLLIARSRFLEEFCKMKISLNRPLLFVKIWVKPVASSVLPQEVGPDINNPGMGYRFILFCMGFNRLRMELAKMGAAELKSRFKAFSS